MRVKCYFFFGTQQEAEKKSFGSRPSGFAYIEQDRIDIYQKSKTVGFMFGAIGSAIEGKGKLVATLSKENVTFMKCDRQKSPTCTFVLKDDSQMLVTFIISKKNYSELEQNLQTF